MLALLIAAPLLQLRCAVVCSEDATATVDSCHQESTAPSHQSPGIGLNHDCTGHAPATAVAVPHRTIPLDGLPAGTLASIHVAISAHTLTFREAAAPGGPPVALVIPLRV